MGTKRDHSNQHWANIMTFQHVESSSVIFSEIPSYFHCINTTSDFFSWILVGRWPRGPTCTEKTQTGHTNIAPLLGRKSGLFWPWFLWPRVGGFTWKTSNKSMVQILSDFWDPKIDEIMWNPKWVRFWIPNDMCFCMFLHRWFWGIWVSSSKAAMFAPDRISADLRLAPLLAQLSRFEGVADTFGVILKMVVGSYVSHQVGKIRKNQVGKSWKIDVQLNLWCYVRESGM